MAGRRQRAASSAVSGHFPAAMPYHFSRRDIEDKKRPGRYRVGYRHTSSRQLDASLPRLPSPAISLLPPCAHWFPSPSWCCLAAPGHGRTRHELPAARAARRTTILGGQLSSCSLGDKPLCCFDFDARGLRDIDATDISRDSVTMHAGRDGHMPSPFTSTFHDVDIFCIIAAAAAMRRVLLHRPFLFNTARKRQRLKASRWLRWSYTYFISTGLIYGTPKRRRHQIKGTAP